MTDLRLVDDYSRHQHLMRAPVRGHWEYRQVYHRHYKPINQPLLEVEKRRRDTQAQLSRYVADTETRPIYNTDYENSGWDEDEISPYMPDTPMRQRQHLDERGEPIRYEDIWNYIRLHGILVRCEVRWLQTMEHHHNRGWHLLAIVVKPVSENRVDLRELNLRNRFPTMRTINPWAVYHVSICSGGDNVSDADMKYLLDKFHGREVRLRMVDNPHRSMGSIALDPERDPIASDPVVRRLWSHGSQRHKKGGLHLSI